ncbi:MBL fold metallo-hydrolase [Microvirga lenta]|uniref:MBL fold metallo-hydrolase n=1 Tax=Microvirga lenta TaxID=2881337 RepID=UPI001CFF7BA8|nr:MBL fold metallo-hydrolase [Microvirga lenta]MCB5176449.1 MBL fold metallo-hydrolase [Microvirga lenta]
MFDFIGIWCAGAFWNIHVDRLPKPSCRTRIPVGGQRVLSRRHFLTLAAALPYLGATSTARANPGSFYYKGPLSDHFDGRRFFNPGGDRPRGFGDFLRWRLSERSEPWPEDYPSPFQDVPPPRVGKHDLRISFVGHATFLIQTGNRNILTDPIWSERASPVPFAGPRRYNPPGISFDNLPPIDAVLISHNHYDHLDVHTLVRLWQRDRPRIVAPLGNDTIIRTHDPRVEVTALDWGEDIELAPGLQVFAKPAHHWSARATNDRNHALWASFVLRSAGRSIYFAGDTGFGGGRHFQEIGERHRSLDIALLPIGAYEPRWFMAPQHMNPEDAVRAFRILKAKYALGFHWGTFKMTNEAVDQPLRDLAAALQNLSISPRRFIAMRPGQVWAGS